MPRTFYSKLEETQRGFWFVLSYLKHSEGEVIAGNLSKKMNVSTARIATLLRRMEQSEVITRHKSSEDARRTIIEITPMGMALADGEREKTLKKLKYCWIKLVKRTLILICRFPDR